MHDAVFVNSELTAAVPAESKEIQVPNDYEENAIHSKKQKKRRIFGKVVTGFHCNQPTVLLDSLGTEWQLFPTNSRRTWLCKLGVIYILEVSSRVKSMFMCRSDS
ncbi:hypothetical protein TNCV_2545841 [Trichonephila clavipes]|nr:hypothetical protein TNCV_2545841 [Trichonephila clavipes]